MPWQEVSTMLLRHEFVMLVREAETTWCTSRCRRGLTKSTKLLRLDPPCGAHGAAS